jgi:hypothetical protein
MTGPEHYSEAERLLMRADGQESDQAEYTVAKRVEQVAEKLERMAAIAPRSDPGSRALARERQHTAAAIRRALQGGAS